MKKLFLIPVISGILLCSFNSCYKTCEEPFAPNYTLRGNCIDLTNSITGTYTGQLVDSIVGLHSAATGSIAVQITKIDDGHVQVSSTAPQFVSITAAVSSSPNGYYLTVPSQTMNGLTVTGAGAYFGSPADGVYAGKQFSVYALAGTQYESFTGTQQ